MERATRLVLTICRVVVDSRRLYASLEKLVTLFSEVYYNNNVTAIEEVMDVLDAPDAEL